MRRLLTLLAALSILLIGSVALAQSTGRRAPAERSADTSQGGGAAVQGRLVNNTNGQNQYTGSGSCDCTGGGSQTYSGCGNAGMDIWVNGTYDPTGSQQAKACADAACAAAGAGSCDLATLSPGATGGAPAAEETEAAPAERTTR